MPQPTFGAGYSAFETYVTSLDASLQPPSLGITMPMIGGQTLTSFFSSSSGQPKALQLSTAEVALEFEGTPSVFLLVNGSSLQLPSTVLDGTIDLKNATGTVTSIDVYSGGTFASGNVTGGTEVAAVTFSSTQYVLSVPGTGTATATLTITGTNLPTSAGTVASILGGTYAGSALALSQIQLVDGPKTVTLSLSATSYSITDGTTSLTLTGTGLPTSLTASQLDGLTSGTGVTFTAGASLSQIQYTNGAQTVTVALSSTAYTVTVGDYRMTLNGTALPTSLTAAQLTDLGAGQKLNLGGDFTSAAITQISTNATIESVTSPFSSGTLVNGFGDFLTGDIAQFFQLAMLIVGGGETSVPWRASVTTTAGSNVDGSLIPTGAFIVDGAGTYDAVQSGDAVGATLLKGGDQYVEGGASSTGTIVQSGGLQWVGASPPPNGSSTVGYSPGADSVNTVIEYGGAEIVFVNSNVSGTTVEGGGDLFLTGSFGPGDGATITNTTFQSRGFMDLYKITATSASVVGSNLIVKNGSTTVETIGLSASSLTMDFGLWSDGNGGTFIGVGTLAAATPSQFASAGLSDLLWRNSNGDVGLWLTKSGGGYTPVDLGIIPTSWQIDATADFNNDGKADILWRNTNGDVGAWMSNTGSGYAGFTSVDFGVIPNSWAIQGTGDFNGDGKSDILWRNTNGDTGVWLSNSGSGYTGFTSVDFGVIPTAWSIDGVGDFTGGAKSDILWRNSNGDVGLWLSNSGSGYTGTTSVDLGIIPTSWTIEGVGDFNGDGKSDILWRNSNGDVGVWLSNAGTGYTGFTSVDFGVIDASWTIQSVGDYNDDGKADILWRNSNGDVGEWLSKPGSGYTGFTSADLGTIPNSWQIADTTAPAAPPPNASLFIQTMASMAAPASTAISTQPPATQPPQNVLAVVS